MAEQRNWAGNYTFTAADIQRPTSMAQLQESVRHSPKVRAFGSTHSFNDIADTSGVMINLAQMPLELSVDHERRTVMLSAGLTYGQICRELDQAGFALHNLASLPHISVAGACATATHGSGDLNGNLATAVSALELVTADGDIVRLSRADDDFWGAVVGLGGFGVVTHITLDVQPTFAMRQDVYEKLPFAHLLENFDAIEVRGYSVSLFTDWRGDDVNQVWLKRRVTDTPITAEPELFGAVLARVPHHPIDNHPTEACTAQLGVPGVWYERLPHFRMDFTPSSGEELQSEYLVPRHHAIAALEAVYGIRERFADLVQISEVRTIAADDLWLSPCYRQPRVGIHFTWVKDWARVRAVLPVIEATLADFDAVPHWGKLFTTAPDRVQALYPKLPDFQRLLQKYDPRGTFRNRFVDTYIFGA